MIPVAEIKVEIFNQYKELLRRCKDEDMATEKIELTMPSVRKDNLKFVVGSVPELLPYLHWTPLRI